MLYSNREYNQVRYVDLGIPGIHATPKRVDKVVLAAILALMLALVGVLMALDARGRPLATTKSDPGAIAGRWAVNCHNSQGMVIEFTVKDKKRAVGKIVKLGRAYQFHYKLGEEIFRLAVTPKGEWVGKFLWRNNDGVKRWEDIVMKATRDMLHATQTSDPCYEYMRRAK
jgi:hypothetical protein